MAGTSKHAWHFIRIGGLDQVSIDSAADLKALSQLNPKNWVALSWPTKGIEMDPRTLALLDSDGDGFIRVPEVIAAVNWSIARLKDPQTLLTGAQDLPLDVVNDAVPEGQVILAAVQRLPGYTPQSAVAVAKDAAEAVKSLSKGALQGDGILRPEAGDSETQQLIRDVAATEGDVNQKNVAAFFADCESFKKWSETAASVAVDGLSNNAAEAFSAVAGVRAKVDDYFARCSLATFDSEAAYGLNRTIDDYRALAAKTLSGGSPELAAFPLAHVSPKRPLPLGEGLNPAWVGAIERMKNSALIPLLGARTELTQDDWNKLTEKLKPFDSWMDTKPASSVAKLGLDRVQAILAGQGKEKLAKLFEADAALQPFSDIERLALYVRDLGVLLRNYVNFFDFYHKERWAVFQAGTLYLDARACLLCVKVDDIAAHATNAAMSRTYLAYLECKRVPTGTIKIAACFTQGDSDFLYVGRNGIFVDRLGQDWEATIVKIVEGPISIRQAFFAPYKRVASFVEDQFAKYAASKDQGITTSLSTAATTPTAASQTFDIAKFAGIFAALGLAVGTISGAAATVLVAFKDLPKWEMPLAIIAALLVVSGPSMILAALKLRQRNLGPLLEASGWAVNGRVKINIPFGSALTERATIPSGSKHQLTDPYADKQWETQKRVWSTLAILVICALLAARLLHTWPFEPVATPAAPAKTATPTAAAK